MSRPRAILPDKTYLVTRNCILRMFLLRPDDVVNNILAYCLAVAAQRTDVTVVLPYASTNHHHTVVYDPKARVSEFTHLFHLFVAKAMNAYLGRDENFWSVEEPSIVEISDVDTLMDELVYVATNPVKDGLVAHVEEWPGFCGLEALLSGEPISTARPSHFFREDGEMMETATLSCALPPQVTDADAFRAELRRRIAADEAAHAKMRRKEKKGRVLGRAAVMRQNRYASPTSVRPRNRLRPRWAANCAEVARAAFLRHLAFQADYQRARKAWCAGERDVVFPAGTYWLRRFAGVNVALTPAEKIS